MYWTGNEVVTDMEWCVSYDCGGLQFTILVGWRASLIESCAAPEEIRCEIGAPKQHHKMVYM